jgi:hypothetical protein
MGAPVAVTRTDFTSGELRALSGRCSDGAQVRRILAIALILYQPTRRLTHEGFPLPLNSDSMR